MGSLRLRGASALSRGPSPRCSQSQPPGFLFSWDALPVALQGRQRMPESRSRWASSASALTGQSRGRAGKVSTGQCSGAGVLPTGDEPAEVPTDLRVACPQPRARRVGASRRRRGLDLRCPRRVQPLASDTRRGLLVRKHLGTEQGWGAGRAWPSGAWCDEPFPRVRGSGCGCPHLCPRLTFWGIL